MQLAEAVKNHRRICWSPAPNLVELHWLQGTKIAAESVSNGPNWLALKKLKQQQRVNYKEIYFQFQLPWHLALLFHAHWSLSNEETRAIFKIRKNNLNVHFQIRLKSASWGKSSYWSLKYLKEEMNFDTSFQLLWVFLDTTHGFCQQTKDSSCWPARVQLFTCPLPSEHRLQSVAARSRCALFNEVKQMTTWIWWGWQFSLLVQGYYF